MTKMLRVRLTQEQWVSWERAAGDAGLAVSEWVRRVVEAALRVPAKTDSGGFSCHLGGGMEAHTAEFRAKVEKKASGMAALLSGVPVHEAIQPPSAR